MTKKRDRGSPATAAQNRRLAPPIRRRQGGENALRRTIPLPSLLLGLLLVVASLAIYRLRYKSPTGAIPLLSVYERGLVKHKVQFNEILAENSRVSENASFRHFRNPVLAYITPWNGRGYEMAKKFTNKFTHISPVWYELKSEGSKLILEGRHNADTGWMSEVRVNGNALVLPRIVLEAYPAELLRKKNHWDKAIDLMLGECKDMDYDGIVLESWSRWAAYGVLQEPDLRDLALRFVKKLGEVLHSVNLSRNSAHHLLLVYVIPPPRSENLGIYDFGPKDFKILSDAVDGFSLMTYDFSGPHSPGPNAPLDWIHSSMTMILGDSDYASKSQVHKIFLGINFYGNDFMLSKGFGGGPIIGSEYLSLLLKYKPVLQWEEKFAEHFFIYSDNHIKHAVFYPTLMSISKRLDEARAWGAGLSIWELGQGLDYFFDLL